MTRMTGRGRSVRKRETFVVAAAQMAPRRTIREAADAVVRFMNRAAGRGARFLVTPEMILTGYHDRFDQAERDRVMGEVLEPACRRYGMTLSVGAGNYRNASGRKMRRPFIQNTAIGPDGRILGVHNKTNPTGGDLEWCAAGDPRSLRVFRSRGLVFGVTICNDFWATPKFTVLDDINIPFKLAGLGARVILHSIQSGHDQRYREFHTRRLEDRARIADVWVVSANCANDVRQPVNAPTGILDPSGKWLVRAPDRGERLAVGRLRV